MFGGRLIPDVLTERLDFTNCADVTCLTLPFFSIRQLGHTHTHMTKRAMVEWINGAH